MESTDDDKKLVSHYTYPDETSLFDLVYSFDWSLTPLGSMDSWSPSLKITVDLCLHTAFPTVIYYGLEHVMIYNQMYRPILQMKHPTALGSPAREVWTEIYDSLKLWIDEIFSNGKGQFRDDILLLMHREGYIEESYFSFTLSPIFGVDETVEGVFNVVQETTQRVLSARRLKTLSGLGNRALGAKTMESACHLVTSTLRDHNEDIHFSLIYIIDTHDNVSYKRANLVATTFDENLKMVKDDDGIEEWNFVKGNSTRELPDFLLDTFDTVCLQDKDSEHRISSYQGTASDANISSKLSTWPIKQVVALNSHLVVTLKDDKSKAILLPVHVSFAGRITLSAVIICGLNPRRALDREYLEFLQLVVSHVSSSLADSRSREEKKQAKILADLNRQKIMFSQNIDHGLMTPLTLMLSPLEESVKACFPDSPMLPDLQLINRSTRRLLKHTSTLLQFSRIEAGNLDAQFRETNIVKYTLELASSFENLAKSLKLSYLIQIPSYEEFYSELKNKVFVDRDMYEKIVFNLCSNAFKHTWTGNVTVRLYPDRINDKESVTLEVSDTGVGIPKDDVSNLFQRFYRIDSSQPRSREGTGIGLALVKELVTRHKGEISVYSELKKGTTFFISLPTGWEHLPEKQVYFVDEEHKLGLGSMDEYSFNERNLYLEESNQWTQDVPNDMDDSIDDTMDFDGLSVLDEKVEQHVFPSLSCDNTSKIHEVYYHILVVDENADMRNYLHRLLRKEFRVHCAYDGRDALRLLRKLPQLPDLILSDVIMPNMDGFELLKLLRSNPVTRLIPVILLSAKGEEDTGVEGLEHGADDYLVKPFSAEELIARVKVNIKLSCFWKQLLLQQKRQSETRELLFSISDKIRSGVNIEKVLNIAVEEFHRILPCDRIFLIRSDPLAFDFSHIMAFSASDPNEENLSGKSAAYVIETKDACIREFLSKHNISDFPQMSEESLKKIHDTLAETNDLIVLENYYTHILDRYVSVIGFPIKTNSSAWGWVLAHRSPNKTWSDSEKVFVQQISNQIGLAISHATLTEEKLKKEAQIEAAKAANEAKGQILANTSHGDYRTAFPK
ncbi:2417_t:CDS:10, partial [Acaulospora morrowiae]